MTAAGWDSDAETVAANLEAALNLALGIHSPSERVKPVGQNVSAGVGTGMTGYDFATDAATLAAALTRGGRPGPAAKRAGGLRHGGHDRAGAGHDGLQHERHGRVGRRECAQRG